MAKRKMKNNDLQNTTQKTKDRATRTPLKTGDDLSVVVAGHNCEQLNED
jgi:hypothetical protein